MPLLMLTLLACGDAPEDAPVTFYEDVAPILMDNCVNCHQEGQIGPFALASYEDAQVVATQIADSVVDRRMPPYLAAEGCNDYLDAAWLSQEDIDTIVEWVEGEQLEGDPANAPTLPEGDVLDDWTHSLLMDELYTADFEGGEGDDYRCFIVDPGLEEDGYLTAFEVAAGNPELVHHVIAYKPYSDDAVLAAEEKDAEEDGPGYTCFGSARVDATVTAAWAPGKPVYRYPEGTGIALEAGQPLILQMHYNDAAGGYNDDITELRLKVEEDVETVMTPFFWSTNIAIPPGEEAHVETSAYTIRDYAGIYASALEDLEILGVGPHMHTLGTSLYSSLHREDGTEDCLVDVPRWDFNWQLGYFFEEPVEVGLDDPLELTCTYDSTGRDETVYWGDGTADEMCLLLLYTSY